MDKVNSILKIKKDAETALKDATDALNEVIIAEAEFQVGDIVRDSYNGTEYKITESNIWCGTELLYGDVKRNKSGEWGKRSYRLYGGLSLVERAEPTS